MLEAFDQGRIPEHISSGKPFILVGHTYQPPREAFLPSSNKRMDVVSGINERIYQESYKPIFTDSVQAPRGFEFSFYPGIRDWIKHEHPQDFNRIAEKINAIPNKEYQVLGDPYLHVILPLQPMEDQEMLLRMGRRAFREDFGFEPKGLWLPETAVSHSTLNAAETSGFEFVVLRDGQLQNTGTNPVRVELGNGRQIAVVHFDTDLNQSLSFKPEISTNADSFLEKYHREDSAPMVGASDTEFYGHHQPQRDKFLLYLGSSGTLEKHGFTPFDIKTALQNPDIQTTDIWENSSWSCGHGNLGRWTGECDCDGASMQAREDKRYYFKTLKNFGETINERLDIRDSDWRDKFVDFYFDNRANLFNSSEVPVVDGGDKLFWAKYCELVGKTSCGWFFGGDQTPEREFPRVMIGEIERLIPDIHEQTVFEHAA